MKKLLPLLIAAVSLNSSFLECGRSGLPKKAMKQACQSARKHASFEDKHPDRVSPRGGSCGVRVTPKQALVFGLMAGLLMTCPQVVALPVDGAPTSLRICCSPNNEKYPALSRSAGCSSKQDHTLQEYLDSLIGALNEGKCEGKKFLEERASCYGYAAEEVLGGKDFLNVRFFTRFARTKDCAKAAREMSDEFNQIEWVKGRKVVYRLAEFEGRPSSDRCVVSARVVHLAFEGQANNASNSFDYRCEQVW